MIVGNTVQDVDGISGTNYTPQISDLAIQINCHGDVDD